MFYMFMICISHEDLYIFKLINRRVITHFVHLIFLDIFLLLTLLFFFFPFFSHLLLILAPIPHSSLLSFHTH